MSADRRRDKAAPARPLQPRLAANASSRTGPTATPRLAAHYASPNPPGVRRPPSALGLDHGSPHLGDPKPSRDASPNITPRSAARRTRPDAAVSAATAMAKPEKPLVRARAQSAVPSAISEKTDSEINRLQAEDIRQRHLSPSPSMGAASSSDSSLFFYANDASSDKPTARPPLQPKASTFFYANGSGEDRGPQLKRTDVASPGTNTESAASVILTPSPSMGPPPSIPSFFRSPSPPKDSFHLTYRKGASQILRPGNQGPISPPNSAHTRQSSDELHDRRRSSIDAVERGMHKKSASVSSTGSGTAAAAAAAAAATTTTTSNSPPPIDVRVARSSSASSAKGVTSPAIPLLRSPLAEHDSFKTPRMTSPERRPIEQVQSPGPNPSDASTVQSDLAANARRERKVLDLEISNSSLLAINRSLEREVRKQKAELRRMRRMSRNSNRSISWQTDLSNTTGKLSALAEDEDELGNDDTVDELEALSDEDSLDEETLSVSALAEHDAKHSESDARRMKSDLKRHRELLVDSQKLNQSIKRCLGVTEHLIRDGTKALEYQVKVHDVELGGRVLSPEEIEERERQPPQHEQESYFDNWTESTRTRSLSLKIPSTVEALGTATPSTTGEEFAPGAAARQVSSTTNTSDMMKEMF